jgi:Na+/melibiose symporter-like transporter
VIGFVSDRTRGKLGRRHPFLYASPIPLAIAFYCIYTPPAGLSGIPLFLWFTFFTLLFRQAVSLYHVPHLALGAELSSDYHERSKVTAWNALFGMVGGVAAFMLGWTLIGGATGPAARAGYSRMGLGIGIASALIVLVSAHFTRDQIPRLPQAPINAPRASLKIFASEIQDCLRNRNYRMTLLGLLFLSATTGTRETLSSYTSLFFWELPETSIRVFGLASPPAYILAFALTSLLHRKFEKRATIMFSGVVLVFAATTPVVLRTLGMMPPNGAKLLIPSLMVFVFLFYLGVAMLMISVLSVLADIADEHELNTGRRQEGVFFASRTFFQQLASGLGHLVAGVAIDVIHFPTGAKPGEVAHEIVTQLAWVEGPLGAIPALLGIYFYSNFHLTRARHAEIQRELVARRKLAATAAQPESAEVAPSASAAVGA